MVGGGCSQSLEMKDFRKGEQHTRCAIQELKGKRKQTEVSVAKLFLEMMKVYQKPIIIHPIIHSTEA